jgi:ankyrin repeat protein
MEAAEQNHLQFVTFLLDHGADINIGDVSNNAPLHVAAQRGLQQCCELLLSRGAKINAKNSEGWTCAYKSTMYSN